ncbi:MAG: hypothetical protein ABIL58_01030 [Pseudomonadota bacterium]
MDRKAELMVALGTAIGANCIPCFDHLYAKSREIGMADDDIQAVAAVAHKVKNGAAMFMKSAVAELAGEAPETAAGCGDGATGCNC